MNEQINLNDIIFTILRIIEGGMGGDKDKIMRYGKELAKRLDEKGYDLAAKCIREQLICKFIY